MNNLVKYGLSLAVIFCWQSCSSDKKPDAIVVSNDSLRDSTSFVTETDTTQTFGNTQNLATTSPDINNNEAVTEQDTTESLVLENGVEAANSKSVVATSDKSKPVKKVVRTRTSVSKVLARDARLAKVMSLKKFSRYMQRRWSYYKGFGEVSYKDATVKIKITDEELKIETPEGKFKMEDDEIKLKTDAGKYKRETRN